MAASSKLSSHTEAYWRNEYQVSPADIDLVAGAILQEGAPVATIRLAAAIIRDRQSREKALAAQLARQTQIYRPMDSFEIGQRLVFTELNLAEGQVVDKRPGNNARYGSFEVIKVAFEGDGETREFAASMTAPHYLNRPIEELVSTSDEGLTGDDAVEAFAPIVADKLRAALAADRDMVPFADSWYLRELLPPVSAGYLNLAEAAIYEAGRPMTAAEILARVPLDVAAPEPAQLFALNRAFEADERFDDLGVPGEQRWFLRALEPSAVFATPPVLADPISATPGALVGVTLLDIIEELGDELDELPESPRSGASSLAFQLNFAHLHAGTLPVSRRLLALLPEPIGDHYPITLADRHQRKDYVVWMVPDKGYICGLSGLYAAAGMTVGVQLTVAAGEAPQTLTLDYAVPRTRRSEWLRSANAQDGRIVLEMKPATLGVRCDPDSVVIPEDREAIAALMATPAVRGAALGDIIKRAFLELAKLSGQGLVHVKTLYMVVNMYRRCGALPIFAYLTQQAAFDPVGEGLWARDGSLEGQVYSTAEEMRERPLSNRSDRLRDQAVPYQGI